jgi:hypothetical protein
MNMDDYYRALGRFVDGFAYVEDMVFVALTMEAGLSMDAAQAVLSGTRVDAAISFMRRLFEARREEMPDRLNEALTQLAAINTVRNSILHWGTRREGEGLRVSNAFRAHSERTRKSFPVSTAMLDDMQDDVGTIISILAHRMMSIKFAKEINDPSNSSAAELVAASSASWKFKAPS